MKTTSKALAVPENPKLSAIRFELAHDPALASRHTQRGYLADLRVFEDWRGNQVLSKRLVEQYAAQLKFDGRSRASINRVLAAIRWYARRVSDAAMENVTLPKEDRDEQVLQAERVAAVKDLRHTGKEQPAGRDVSFGELAALMAACAADETPFGVRDASIIALAAATGARRAEIAAAWSTDYQPLEGDRAEIILYGKGEKDRKAYLNGGAARALADWMRLRGPSEGFVYCAIHRSGSLDPDHGLTTEALALMLERRLLQAGVSPLTWHDFRRTFAGEQLDAGTDLVTIQRLMGHASPVTTGKYDRRKEDVRRQAAGKMHVPYTERALLPPRKVKK